ncbi:predicted protein, partial [Nematostella vectensis]
LGLHDGRIPDSSITASTVCCNIPASRARLTRLDYMDDQFWGANILDTNQWLQIDLQRRQVVSAVATQGRINTIQFTTMYYLAHGMNSAVWSLYPSDSSPKPLGNAHWNIVANHILSPPVYARFLRFLPQTYRDHIVLRVELFTFGMGK